MICFLKKNKCCILYVIHLYDIFLLQMHSCDVLDLGPRSQANTCLPSYPIAVWEHTTSSLRSDVETENPMEQTEAENPLGFPVFGHVRHVHSCKENRYTPPGCTNSNEKGKESRKTNGSKDCKNWGLESASFCKVSSRYWQWQNITQLSTKPNLPKNSPKHPKIFVLGFTARTGDVHAAFVAASSISWHSESISWTAKGKEGHRVLKNTESRKSDESLKFQVGHMSHSIQTPWKMWHCASSPYRSITYRSSTFPLPFHCSLTILLFPGFKKLQGLLLLCCAGLSVRRAGWGFSLICGLSQDKWPSKMGTCHWEGHQVFLMHICRV